MAIPIRLLAGLGNEIEIDLVAQSIDMSVDRNVSAFPTPNNYLKRFAIDTNIPRVKIDISGIFVDDAGVSAVEEGGKGYPAAMMINCASILPTVARSVEQNVKRAIVFVSDFIPDENNIHAVAINLPALYSHLDHPIGTVSTIVASASGSHNLRVETIDVNGCPIPFDLTDKVLVQVGLKFDGAHSAGVVPAAFDVESILEIDGSAVAITEDIGASTLLHPGARVVKSDGTFLGIVASTTDTSITFEQNLASSISDGDEVYTNLQLWNEKDEFVGYVTSLYDDDTIDVDEEAKWYINLVSQNEAAITEGMNLSINARAGQWNSVLDNEYFKIIPSYWLENPHRNPKYTKVYGRHIGARLIFDADTSYTTAPTVTEGATASSRNPSGWTPSTSKYFDAEINIPVKDITHADNPAVELASKIQAALQLEVSMIDSAYDSKSVRITNDDGTYTYSNLLSDTFSVQRKGPVVIIKQVYVPDDSLEHPDAVSPSLQAKFPVEVYYSNNGMDANVRKSAGDKVQDLIGIVSNAGKLTDLLRGIQIPYDSLVTSSGVTGVARNFFLTFGEIPITEKGALSNERAVSLPMDELLLHDDWGGNSPDKGKRNIFDKLVDAVIPDDIQALSGWLAGAAKDMWVTLDTPAHGNAGGIRIIPERLHVRYDAGNNYYAFNLELIASDFVIGV